MTVTMFWFSVHVLARAPGTGALRAVVSDEAAGKLMDLLADHGGVAAAHPCPGRGPHRARLRDPLAQRLGAE